MKPGESKKDYLKRAMKEMSKIIKKQNLTLKVNNKNPTKFNYKKVYPIVNDEDYEFPFFAQIGDTHIIDGVLYEFNEGGEWVEVPL